jgi:hypothetical protein
LALLPVTFFALAHCGSSGTSAPASAAPAGGDDTDSAGVLRTCQKTCRAAADCGTAGQPLQDASHYECNAGVCEWQGCKSTSDCASALGTNRVACVTAPGAQIATCVPACSTAADCAVQGSVLSDASHFACNAGVCEWEGCKSTTECTTALSTSHVACEKPESAPTKTCVPTCHTAADCAVPGEAMYDAGHFACTAGRCVWQGCKSTHECSAALDVQNVVCQ